jgi:hypothetical protein
MAKEPTLVPVLVVVVQYIALMQAFAPTLGIASAAKSLVSG